MAVTSSEPAKVDIDMTPMIDIVFQLLTFFMVVINFEAADADERVKMAISDLARPAKVKPPDELMVQIGYNRDRDGNIKSGPWIFYLGREVPIERFEQDVLKREKAFFKLKHPNSKTIDTVVVIRADQFCPTGKVQEVMKVCLKNEYGKFSLKAMQPES